MAITVELSLLTPICFAIIAVVLIVIFTVSILQGFSSLPLFQPISNPVLWIERRRLSQKISLLRRASELQRSGAIRQSLPLLTESIFLRYSWLSPVLINEIHTHHLSLLERLVAASESLPSHIGNLPIVEELLSVRTRLLKELFENKETRKKLRRRAQEKSTPEWAISECDKQTKDIKERLDINARSLRSELGKLLSNFERGRSSPEEITYH